MRSWTRLFLPCAIGIILSGCATRQSVDSLRGEVSKLRDENFELRKELAEARVRLQIQQDRGGPGAASDTVPLDSSRSATGAAGPASAAASTKKDALSRVIYSEPITDPSIVTAPRGKSGGAGASGAARLMRSARQSLDTKDPVEAMTSFRQILAEYPGDALADDAQFGIGECYFQMGKYEDAITEYQRVASSFPFGDQVPFAFLKVGFAHLALEQRDLALDNFKTVSEAYPGTEAATVARQQIAHLKASGR